MKTNTLTTVLALSDRDLLARLETLAVQERGTTSDLVAHLAALELRPSLYEAQGYGSLFAYCTEALRLSEDAACNRIDAARACRSFPVILDLLASGALTLTSVRKLWKHLTPENHEVVLARAQHQKKEQIEALVAELAPRPDVVASVRKVPATGPTATSASDLPVSSAPLLELVALTDERSDSGAACDRNRAASPPASRSTTPPPSSAPRPVVQALSPGRYRVQFTIGQEAYERLRRLQTLLRREVPNGDAGVIFERFIDVLLDKVERDKLGKRGKAKKARTGRRSTEVDAPDRAYENGIRSGTDRADSGHVATGLEPRKAPTRHISSAVKRAVWFRDRAQCAFVADTGHRCSERTFLQLHHIHPYALDGPATLRNISLRCPRHNQYEAELVFGVRTVRRDDPGG